MSIHDREKMYEGRTARITTKSAATYLGVSIRTLEDWRAKDKGPRFLKIGRKVRYEVPDLDAFLASCRHAND